MRPDKAKVVDEVWDEARIDQFLDKQPMGSEDGQFSVLLNAYRAMRPADFGLFIAKYKARGGDVDVQDVKGRTLAQVIDTHEKSQPFRDILAG